MECASYCLLKENATIAELKIAQEVKAKCEEGQGDQGWTTERGSQSVFATHLQLINSQRGGNHVRKAHVMRSTRV